MAPSAPGASGQNRVVIGAVLQLTKEAQYYQRGLLYSKEPKGLPPKGYFLLQRSMRRACGSWLAGRVLQEAFFVGLSMGFLPGQSLSVPKLYSDTLYIQAQRWYFQAVQSEDYLPRAESAFQTLVRRYGPQPCLQMYLYGITALKARYALNLLKKRDYFFQAVAQMDAQVARTPEDVEVRFLRGSFYYYLPSFLGKRQAAQEDIQTVARLLLAKPDQMRNLYQPEVLRAIVGFLAQTKWIPADALEQLRQLYGR
jgi:hypothetical protein